MAKPEPPPGTGRSVGRASWLDLASGGVMVFLHPSERPCGTSVLLVPPFGWEEEKSYRGRRTWADVLADAGYAAARLDLPGTGDSAGGARDPGRVAAGTAAVSAAAAWLRRRTGCERLVAVGIGLGGLLSWRAAAQGAPIDDLVLWGVPDTGRRLLREVRAQAGIVAAGTVGAGQSPGELDAVGYVLTAEAIAELEAIRLEELPLPDRPGRRALVLTRGRLASDRTPAAHLERAGAEVTVAEVPGWEELMTDPEKSQPPAAAIEATFAWLRAAGPGGGEVGSRAPAEDEAERDELVADGVRERVITFERGGGRLVAVACEPAHDTAAAPFQAVLLNAGSIRHSGPNRNWVELARRWARLGIPSVRVDLYGVGDSDGDPALYLKPGGPYTEHRLSQVPFVLDELERLGLGRRFLVLGLCTSAVAALLAALGSDRFAGLILINQNVIFWDPALVEQDLTIKALDSLRGRSWRRLADRDVSLAELRAQMRKLNAARILASVRRNSERRRRTDRAFDQLREQDIETLFLFGQHEPLFDRLQRDGQLARLGRWPNVRVERLTPTNERVPAGDHTFRTLSLQHELHECLDRALERTLARCGVTSSVC